MRGRPEKVTCDWYVAAVQADRNKHSSVSIKRIKMIKLKMSQGSRAVDTLFTKCVENSSYLRQQWDLITGHQSSVWAVEKLKAQQCCRPAYGKHQTKKRICGEFGPHSNYLISFYYFFSLVNHVTNSSFLLATCCLLAANNPEESRSVSVHVHGRT